MRSMKSALVASSVAVLLVFANISRAETVMAKLVGLVPMAGGTLFLDGSTLSGYGVGELEWDGTGQGNTAPFTSTFSTFCIDLPETINFNKVYGYTLDAVLSTAPKAPAYPAGFGPGPMGATKASEIDELYGSHFASLMTNDDNQAFQLALWNIIYDSDTSVSSGSGSFYVTSGIDSTAISEANAWLAEAANPANLALHDQTDVVALLGQEIGTTGAFAQDQVVIDSLLGAPHLTPLPSAGMAAFVLMGVVGLVQWWRGRRGQLI